MPFESLQDVLAELFELPLEKLPSEVRQRVEKEYIVSWDQLSVDQRREYAWQCDYQHDPAMESDRQHWWDFYQRMQGVEKQIEHWNSIATPSAQDLAAQEARLAELQRELARMKAEEIQKNLSSVRLPTTPNSSKHFAPTQSKRWPTCMKFTKIRCSFGRRTA